MVSCCPRLASKTPKTAAAKLEAKAKPKASPKPKAEPKEKAQPKKRPRDGDGDATVKKTKK